LCSFLIFTVYCISTVLFLLCLHDSVTLCVPEFPAIAIVLQIQQFLDIIQFLQFPMFLQLQHFQLFLQILQLLDPTSVPAAPPVSEVPGYCSSFSHSYSPAAPTVPEVSPITAAPLVPIVSQSSTLLVVPTLHPVLRTCSFFAFCISTFATISADPILPTVPILPAVPVLSTFLIFLQFLQFLQFLHLVKLTQLQLLRLVQFLWSSYRFPCNSNCSFPVISLLVRVDTLSARALHLPVSFLSSLTLKT
jgi:hypothetical protein